MPTLAAPAVPVEHRPPRRWPPVAVLLACWTVVGLFFGMRQYVNALLFDQPVPDHRPMTANLFDGYMWAAYTPLIFLLARTFRFHRRVWPLSVAVHLVMAAGIGLLSVYADIAFSRFLWPDEPAQLAGYFRAAYYTNIQWYVVIVGVWHARNYYRRVREHEVQAAGMNARLAEARLEALKMQIQPHFLFNTLHTISELVHEDPRAADRMITRLGDLLRLTVDNAQTHEVTLAQEMEFLHAYLEIQRTRFQDTLEVEVSVPPETHAALVPNLVLQPLVENAIRHGTAPRGGTGRITVTASRQGERLRLQVSDNGPGLPANGARRNGREGVGVRNTRARLEQLYGPGQHLELANGPRGGVVATVEIPFRPAPAEVEAAEIVAVGA